MESRTDKNKQNKQESNNGDDVHKKLFHWFEKRGLLLELRAHMRQQMVRALQENVTGLNTSRKRWSSSPKFQAIHMVIADFLLQQEHHYTVSVFSTEVPILNSLPEFSHYINDILQASKDGTLAVTTSAPRFSSIDIQDILETLGLPPHTQAGAYAAELYAEGGEALLTCIVRALSAQNGVGTSQQNFSATNNQLSVNYSSVRNDTNDSDDEGSECCGQNDEQWTSEMRGILQSDMKIRHIHKLQEKMKKFQENEILRIREEEACKYEALCAQQEADVERRVREEVSREFAERERELEEQKEALHDLALQLHVEHAEITDRLSQLQIQSEEIEDMKKRQESESELMEKQKEEIVLQKKQIEESFARLTTEQENLRPTKESPKPCPEHLNVDAEVKKFTERDGVLVLRESCSTNSTQTESQNFMNREQQTVCISQPDTDLIQQLQLERETINQLQEESVELRAYILQQRCRIDQLTHRATSLATQLEEAQQSIAQHECQERVIARWAAPVHPPRPPSPVLHLNWQTPQTGAGDESIFAPRYIPQQLPTRHEARRRPLNFNCRQTVSPTSEDSSPTNEILQETRRRLRYLEEESAEVNRCYREFQTRQLEASNPIVINRSQANQVTNYSSAPIPSQISLRRIPVFNHPRLRTQAQYSDDSDDDDLDIINLRRHTLSNRHRNISRLYVPHDNSLLSKRLYFTNFKHFSKYTSFKKRFGKSPMRKLIFGAKCERMLERGHTVNQAERIESNPTTNENQACQNNVNFFTERDTSSSDSSSDSESLFDRNKSVKYKSARSTPRRVQHCKRVIPTVENIDLTMVNDSEIPGPSKVNSVKHSNEEKNTKEILLPKIMNPLSSAISSNSLAVESIPKDDSNNGQEKSSEQIVTSDTVLLDNRITDIEEVPIVERHSVVEDRPVLLEQLPLTVPNLSLLNEETAHEGQPDMLRGLEQQERNVEVLLSAVAVSVTSGSDIFRELENSQSENSDDIISAPHDDRSKRSSDFWE